MLLVDEVDNKDFLTGLFDVMYDEASNAELGNATEELEAKYESHLIFIAFSASKNKASIWIDKEEYKFDSVENLLQSAQIDGYRLIDIWNNIEFEYLY